MTDQHQPPPLNLIVMYPWWFILAAGLAILTLVVVIADLRRR
jgi:hypothetical protein